MTTRPRHVPLALFADGADLPLFAGHVVPVVEDAPSAPLPTPEPQPVASWAWVGPPVEDE